MAERLPDWPLRLVAYVTAQARRPFAPGDHDCALFVAGAVAAMTGEDPAEGVKGRYTTVKGGLRVLRAAGFADHVAAVAARCPEIPVLRAGVGDIAVVDGDDGLPALGIVQGEAIYVLHPTGLALLPLTRARRAFRV